MTLMAPMRQNAVTRPAGRTASAPERRVGLRSGTAMAAVPHGIGNQAMLRLQRRTRREDAAEREAETMARSAAATPGTDLGRALGTDLSGVGLHTGSEADRSAEAMGARAYTVGGQAFFRTGALAASAAASRHLLAHEVVHVIQQGGAPRLAPPATQLMHVSPHIVHGDWLDDLRRGASEGAIAGLRAAQRALMVPLESWANRQIGTDRSMALSIVREMRSLSDFLVTLLVILAGVLVGFAAGIVDTIRGIFNLLIGIFKGVLLFIYGFIDGGAAFDTWASGVLEGLRLLPEAIKALVDAWLEEFEHASTDRQTFMIAELTGQLLALIATFEFTASRAARVPALTARVTAPALVLAEGAETAANVPARAVVISVDVARPVAIAGLAGGIVMRVPTPEGTVTPSRGPHQGKPVAYGDPRGKHTRVGEYTTEELEKAARGAKSAPKSGELTRFHQAVERKNVSYGGQLGSEAIARYGDLVLAALEEGTERAGKFFHEAAEAIGIDISTGKPTRRYRVDGAPNGAHIIPEDW